MNRIDGTTKKEVITGTTLQDEIYGLAGNDTIDARAGDDFVSGSSGRDKLFGSLGNDFISGGSGNDYISDGDGDDVVLGGEGDDFVKAGRGNDVFSGGKGFDTIDFSNAKTGLTADLSKGLVTGRGDDVVQGFERFIGSIHADDIKGSNDADVIEAGAGENVIRGLGGADVLSGGGEHDTFVWKAGDVLDAKGAHRGVDTIIGFESNDTLDISGLLNGLGVTQRNADEFVRLTDVEGGTMVQVRQGGDFVDVALLADLHTGGAMAGAWASDGLILI